MFDSPLDALPPSPATQDPTLQAQHDPLGLPGEDVEEMGLGESAHPLTLDCQDLENRGLWDTEDCCHGLCHAYEQIRPEPLHYRHITVRGCCASHEALGHLDPPQEAFLDRLFGPAKRARG